MFGLVRRVLRGIVSLAVLLAVAYAGWRWGGPLFERLQRLYGQELEHAEAVSEVPSEAVAERAVEGYRRFSRERGTREFTVSEVEATSVLRHRAGEALPPGILTPDIRFREGGLRASFRLVRSEVPDFPDLGGTLGLLPDTIPVELDLGLIPFSGHQTAFVVRRMKAGAVPVPMRFVPAVLAALGRPERPGLPPEAILLPLPPEVASAYILEDGLHLVGRP